MSRISLENIDDMQMDVLREIGNIGAGNAATALSQLIDDRINMEVPKVELLNFNELSDIVGGAENVVAGVFTELCGEINGMMMFIMDQKSACSLVSILLKRNITKFDDYDEVALSALTEIGNIISGAYFHSLSTLMNLCIYSSVPNMTFDMAGAILSVPAIEFGKVGDKALLIQSRFGQTEMNLTGYILLIPTVESYDKILKTLGM